jgi:hypothetical protein
MGSQLSLVAVLVALGVRYLGRMVGSPDAWWVELIGWVALVIFAVDILCALLSLTPRKRWWRVMNFGLIVGATLSIVGLMLHLKGEDPAVELLIAGVALMLLLGGGGCWMWCRALRRLNSQLLDRKWRKTRKV